VAWSASSLSNYSILFDAGYPMFVPRNIVEDATQWLWVNGTSFAEDQALNQYPSVHAKDGRPWTNSRCGTITSYSSYSYSFIFKVNTEVENINSLWSAFDTYGFIATEPLDLGVNPVMRLYAGDSSSSFDLVHTTALTGAPTRWLSTYESGGSYLRVNGATWCMVSFQNMNSAPNIGQIIVGTKAFLPAQPNRPYDSAKVSADVRRLPVNGRRLYAYTIDYGYADQDLSFTIDGYPAVGKSGTILTQGFYWADRLWDDNDQGSRPIYYMPSASVSSADFSANLLVAPPDIAYTEATYGQVTLSLQELPPYKAVQL